jgi:hypothetical protein
MGLGCKSVLNVSLSYLEAFFVIFNINGGVFELEFEVSTQLLELLAEVDPLLF